MPMSASRRAGASLTPSPVIATTWPRACSARAMRSFSSGRHPGHDHPVAVEQRRPAPPRPRAGRHPRTTSPSRRPARPRGRWPARCGVVTGDHGDPDVGRPAGRDGLAHVARRWVLQADQAEETGSPALASGRGRRRAWRRRAPAGPAPPLATACDARAVAGAAAQGQHPLRCPDDVGAVASVTDARRRTGSKGCRSTARGGASRRAAPPARRGPRPSGRPSAASPGRRGARARRGAPGGASAARAAAATASRCRPGRPPARSRRRAPAPRPPGSTRARPPSRCGSACRSCRCR